MTNVRTVRRLARAGFTMVELLVVILIIAVLMALTTGAVMRVMASQQASATQTMLTKLDSVFRQQMEALKDDVDQEFRNAKADQFFSNTSRDVMKQQYLQARLKQEFPLSFAEARTAIPVGNTGQSLQPKATYTRVITPALVTAVPDLNLQASICIYLSLTQARRGMEGKLEESVGASSIRIVSDTKYLVDVWGSPISCPHDAKGNPVRDLLGLPVMLSAGSDRAFSIYPNPPTTTPMISLGDDLLSDKMRQNGARGD